MTVYGFVIKENLFSVSINKLLFQLLLHAVQTAAYMFSVASSETVFGFFSESKGQGQPAQKWARGNRSYIQRYCILNCLLTDDKCFKNVNMRRLISH